jgi:hypothetical protein
MTDSSAEPHVPTLGETKQGSIWPHPKALKAAFPWSGPEAFKAAYPRLDEALKAIRAQLNPEVGKAAYPRLDEALKAIRAQLNPEVGKAVSTQLKALTSAATQLNPEVRKAALILCDPEALKAALTRLNPEVRCCRHCKQPLYIHLPNGTREPCTRSNRFSCGSVSHQMGQRLLVGNLECVRRRNAAKGRRRYAARKARAQAGNTAPVLDVTDGKARPQ